jgi:hypothetical protein
MPNHAWPIASLLKRVRVRSCGCFLFHNGGLCHVIISAHIHRGG